MNFYSDDMPHECTVWPKEDFDKFGHVIYGQPEVLQCRWQDTAQLFLDADGREFVSASVVYVNGLPKVGDAITFGSSSSSEPLNSHRVRSVQQSPDLDEDLVLVKVVI